MTDQRISMKDKLLATFPYNLFYTEVLSSKETAGHINSIQFSDLLCPSLGKLKRSLHITNGVEIEWLMSQYKSKNVGNTPITLLFDHFKLQNFKRIDPGAQDPALDKYKNITYKKIEKHGNRGVKEIHNSRISIFEYTNGSMRVVVSGASLCPADWELHQNTLWVSQTLPPLTKSSNKTGDSPTMFKTTLFSYLKSYSLNILEDWISVMEKIDFNRIRVFLVVNVPGYHSPKAQLTHQQRVSNILFRHCKLPAQHQRKDQSWEIHINLSQPKFIGESPDIWMNNIAKALKTTNDSSDDKSDVRIKLIYPSLKNVLVNVDKRGSGLRYTKEVHNTQLWLQDYLCEWQADTLSRSNAVATSHTYSMIEPSEKKMAWFLLTSANFSKKEWGKVGKASVAVGSYETGVLFVPRFFNKDYFTIGHVTDKSSGKLFPVMYDLPLNPYGPHDSPFVIASYY